MGFSIQGEEIDAAMDAVAILGHFTLIGDKAPFAARDSSEVASA